MKNRYADIGAVWEAVRNVLPKHGLSVVQTMRPRDDGKAAMHTMLMHVSGQWISGECVLPAPKQDPQGYGSAITYARRYSLSAILGVVSEEDDDGNAAGDAKGSRKKNGGTPDTCVDEQGPPPRLATDKQIQRIQILFNELAVYDPKKFKERNDRIQRINKVHIALVHHHASPAPASMAKCRSACSDKSAAQGGQTFTPRS